MSDNDDQKILHPIPIDEIPVIDPLTELSQSAGAKELPPLSKVGYNLSRFILWIISGYLFFLVIYLIISVVNSTGHAAMIPSPDVADSTFNKQLQVFKAMQEENKNSRDFITQISQMVLLNLLLPTLTAILGYIFGSREESKK